MERHPWMKASREAEETIAPSEFPFQGNAGAPQPIT